MKTRIDAKKTTQKTAAGNKKGSSTQNQTAEIVDCATGFPLEIGDDGEIPNLIMFVPAGTSRIQPMINGAPAPEEIELSVDSSVLETLQRDLDQRWTKNVRPIGDFDHKPGPAAFLPKRFEWRDGEGLFLEVDWTASGEKAVRGKDYSYFSPSFKMADGKIVGLPEKGAIGALTNSPAFRDIKRIAASEPEPEPNNGHQANDNNMNQILTQCVTLGLVTETSDEVRATSQLVASITALNKRVEAAEAQVETYKKKEEDTRKEAATAAIDAAIKEGRLPGKNERIKTFWVNAMLADPEGTKATIESIKPDPVLTQTFHVKAGDTGHRIINGVSVQEQLQVKLAAIRAANPNVSLEDCYVMLEAQNPELVAAAQVEISPPARS
jgi:Mu-like prophage I protein